MSQPKSNGTCHFCQTSLDKSKMTRHLQSCKKRQARTGQLFHIFVEAKHRPQYWLHLETLSSNSLVELDLFLRGLWLECCGHLSQFEIEKQRYLVSPPPVSFADEAGELSMDVSMDKILRPGLKFLYTYDLGNPTVLELRVIGVREGEIHDDILQILARNVPPEHSCAICSKKDATLVCPEHDPDAPEAWLCDLHAKEHPCGAEMLLPVVNSPRVGVCGYTGES